VEILFLVLTRKIATLFLLALTKREIRQELKKIVTNSRTIGADKIQNLALQKMKQKIIIKL